ncbi:MAG: hypothetical protein P8179_08375 [Candidatus Thiodiazotropha sp.]|jgi:hypothetical protein
MSKALFYGAFCKSCHTWRFVFNKALAWQKEPYAAENRAKFSLRIFTACFYNTLLRAPEKINSPILLIAPPSFCITAASRWLGNIPSLQILNIHDRVVLADGSRGLM